MSVKKSIAPLDDQGLPREFRSTDQAVYHIGAFLERMRRRGLGINKAVRCILDGLRAVRCRIERLLNPHKRMKAPKARSHANRLIRAALQQLRNPIAPEVLKAFAPNP